MLSKNLQVVGIGQCGTRIGQEFARQGVNAIYVNSDAADAKGVNAKNMLLVESTGTGGSPVKGKEFFDKHKKEFSAFLDKNLDPDKLVLFIAGGGGGTGGGFITPAAEYAITKGYKVGVIYTLPPKMLGMLAINNAFKTLKILRQLELKTFVLADNEFLMNFVGVSEMNWWQEVNKHIVAHFHFIFDITRDSKITAAGFGSIDKGEVSRILQYGQGLTDIRVVEFSNKEVKTMDDAEIKKALFATGLIEKYDYKKTLAYITSIDVPAKGDYNTFSSIVFNINKKMYGSSLARIGMSVDPTLTDSVRVTMVNSGLDFPKVLKSSINNLKRDDERYKNKAIKGDSLNLNGLDLDSISDDFNL